MLTKPDLNSMQVVFFRQFELALLETVYTLQKELFQSLQRERCRLFKNNFLVSLEKTFQFLQKELCRLFKKNFLVPLERTVQSLQKKPCRFLKNNFLVPLEGTIQTLQKEIFRPFRKNSGLLNFLDHLYKKTPFCMYYCKVWFITFCYTNNVNTILKIDSTFLLQQQCKCNIKN